MKKLERSLKMNLELSKKKFVIDPVPSQRTQRIISNFEVQVDIHNNKNVKKLRASGSELPNWRSLKSIPNQRTAADWRKELLSTRRHHTYRQVTLTSQDTIRVTDTPAHAEEFNRSARQIPKPDSRIFSSTSKRVFGRPASRVSGAYGLFRSQTSLETLPPHEQGSASSRGISASRIFQKSRVTSTSASRERRVGKKHSFFDRQVSVSELARFAHSSNRELDQAPHETTNESQILITSLAESVNMSKASPLTKRTVDRDK